MDIVTRGNAFTLLVSVKDGVDKDFPLMTPSGGVTCTLYKPDATAVFTAQPMTATETGLYSLTRQTDNTWQLGTYRVVTTSTHNGFTNTESQYFQLVSEL